jgi:hypothetical protein
MRAFLLLLWFGPGALLIADGLYESAPVVLHAGVGAFATSLYLALVLVAVVEGAKQ